MLRVFRITCRRLVAWPGVGHVSASQWSHAAALQPRPRPRPMFLVSLLSLSPNSPVIGNFGLGDAIVMLTLPNSLPLLHLQEPLLLLPSPRHILPLLNHDTTMSISLSSHAFAGNPIRSRTPKPTSQFSPNTTLESLKSRILSGVPGNSLTQVASPDFKVLPFRKGRPLATSGEDDAAGPRWRLRWMGLDECGRFLGELSDDRFVYLGWRDRGNDDGVVYWAIDVSEGGEGIANVMEEGWCFVELRTLMVATDWDDQSAMGELAIAGHVRVRARG